MVNLASKLLQKVYEVVYIVDFTLLEESPAFNEEIRSIGTWFDSDGQRWICHTELSAEEFKTFILNHVRPEDAEKVRFYKDHLPFTGNQEVAF